MERFPASFLIAFASSALFGLLARWLRNRQKTMPEGVHKSAFGSPSWRAGYAFLAGTNVFAVIAVLVLVLKPVWFPRVMWMLPVCFVTAYVFAPWLYKHVRLTVRDYPS